MKRSIVVACFSLVMLLGLTPAAHAGGGVFVSFGFGLGAGYYGPYAPYYPPYYAYYPYPYPYPYYGIYGSYGYYGPRVIPRYGPRYYPGVRAYSVYPHGRVVSVPRRGVAPARVYGHYVPRAYYRHR